MKTHFGIIYNGGDYESPLLICDNTLCGYDGEIPCENAVDNWKLVTCKKCLRLRESYEYNEKENEKHIIKQMGDMTDFFKKDK